MKLHDVLATIQRTADKNNLSTPFIVGGTVRDRVRNEAKEINDIDLTSEDGDSVKLAFACSKVLPYSFFQLFDDGHASMKLGQLQIDFSNHFVIPDIKKELERIGVKNNSALIQEMYSRDFTINTLIQDLDFQKIYDLTEQGVKDIKSGVIRCPINSDLTISNDPKRILRALRFAMRFDYTIDADLIRSIKKYKHLLKKLSPEYLKDKANELIKLDADKAIKWLVELGLLDVIPLTKIITDALIEKKMLYYAFGR